MRVSICSCFYFWAMLCFFNKIEATKEFGDRTGNACMFCHRKPSGGASGRPNLRPEGISFIKKLIEEEVYVPINKIRELNLMGDKIAENKAIQDGVHESLQEKSTLETEANDDNNDETLEPSSNLVENQDLLPPVISTEPLQPEAITTNSEVLSSTSSVAGLEVVSEHLELIEPGVKLKGSKIFIMRRNSRSEIPQSYILGEDWDYDDYF